VRLATIVDDGEAATLAVAEARGLQLATDDRKARRVCAELGLPEPIRSLHLCAPMPTPPLSVSKLYGSDSYEFVTELAFGLGGRTLISNGGPHTWVKNDRRAARQ
jgi:hypothetical protein